MRTVIYPGSFDPVTNGHIDVAERASAIFDKVIIAVAINAEKNPLFTIEERMDLIRGVCRHLPNVEVSSFSGLLVNALKTFNASAVIRGLRALTDFEYEFQMALMNRGLNPKCETLFMMPSPEYSYVSSRLIKEIVKCGGDVSSFIDPAVAKAMKIKFGLLKND